MTEERTPDPELKVPSQITDLVGEFEETAKTLKLKKDARAVLTATVHGLIVKAYVAGRLAEMRDHS